jgi:hypothetical protein
VTDHPPGPSKQRVGRLLGAAGSLVAVILLTGCSGDGGNDLPTPTRSVTKTDLPSLTASLPTRSSMTDESAPTQSSSGRPSSESPSSSATTTTEPTSEKPSTKTTSAAPSRSKTSLAATSTTESASPATESTEATKAAESSETTQPTKTPVGSPKSESDKGGSGGNGDDGDSGWWWLAALVAVGAVAAAAIGLRARRRSKWQEQLDSARSEARWFAEELLPRLQRTGSAAELAGGWQVGAPRVASTEDQLTGLAARAPGEEQEQRSLALRDAVRTARQAVEDVIAGGAPGTATDELRTVASRLSEALAADRRP